MNNVYLIVVSNIYIHTHKLISIVNVNWIPLTLGVSHIKLSGYISNLFSLEIIKGYRSNFQVISLNNCKGKCWKLDTAFYNMILKMKCKCKHKCRTICYIWRNIRTLPPQLRCIIPLILANPSAANILHHSKINNTQWNYL